MFVFVFAALILLVYARISAFGL